MHPAGQPNGQPLSRYGKILNEVSGQAARESCLRLPERFSNSAKSRSRAQRRWRGHRFKGETEDFEMGARPLESPSEIGLHGMRRARQVAMVEPARAGRRRAAT